MQSIHLFTHYPFKLRGTGRVCDTQSKNQNKTNKCIPFSNFIFPVKCCPYSKWGVASTFLFIIFNISGLFYALLQNPLISAAIYDK